MMLPGDHAEIMKGQARVKPVHNLQNARAHGGDLRVVGNDGVIVDDEINVQPVSYTHLDVYKRQE